MTSLDLSGHFEETIVIADADDSGKVPQNLGSNFPPQAEFRLGRQAQAARRTAASASDPVVSNCWEGTTARRRPSLSRTQPTQSGGRADDKLLLLRGKRNSPPSQTKRQTHKCSPPSTPLRGPIGIVGSSDEDSLQRQLEDLQAELSSQRLTSQMLVASLRRQLDEVSTQRVCHWLRIQRL
eukprot:SAG31_NODE_613_length_13545_cov_10.972557_15_plen_181_part_00